MAATTVDGGADAIGRIMDLTLQNAGLRDAQARTERQLADARAALLRAIGAAAAAAGEHHQGAAAAAQAAAHGSGGSPPAGTPGAAGARRRRRGRRARTPHATASFNNVPIAKLVDILVRSVKARGSVHADNPPGPATSASDADPATPATPLIAKAVVDPRPLVLGLPRKPIVYFPCDDPAPSNIINTTPAENQRPPQPPKTLPSLRVRGPKLDTTSPSVLGQLDVGPRSASFASARPDDRPAGTADPAADEPAGLAAMRNRFLTTQRRCWTLEREVKKRADTIVHWKKKGEEVAAHCERLMFHLKQETAAKATAQYKVDDGQRRLRAARKKVKAVMEERDRLQHTITLMNEGCRVLESQLRMLDKRFVQLRGTLDWHTHHARGEMQTCAREFVRLSTEIEKYKEAWTQAAGQLKRVELDQRATLSTRATTRRRQAAAAAPGSSGSEMDEDAESAWGMEERNGTTAAESAVAAKGGQKPGRAPEWRFETVSTTGGEVDPLPDWELSDEAEEEEGAGEEEEDAEGTIHDDT